MDLPDQRTSEYNHSEYLGLSESDCKRYSEWPVAVRLQSVVGCILAADEQHQDYAQ